MPVSFAAPLQSPEELVMSENGAKRIRRQGAATFRARLERSRQSARECRARKNLRYQYMEELIVSREKAISVLREELNQMKEWCIMVDRGVVPADLLAYVEKERSKVDPQPTNEDTTDDNAMLQSKQ